MSENEGRSGALQRKPKICHLIHDDGPGGGPKTVVNHITFYVDYFDLTVIHGGTGRIANVCRQLKIPSYTLPINHRSTLIWSLPLLAGRLRSIKPDLLILHGQWGALIGAIAGKLAGVQRMLYLAQWPAFYTDWDVFRMVRNRLSEAIPCRLADATVAISRGNYYQYLVRRLVDEDRLHLIHNSIDQTQIPSREAAGAMREKLGWNDGNCHVVSVGRLTDQKRLDWLLRSWRMVAAKAGNARLWIIGDGPARPFLESLRNRLGIETSCQFLGDREDGTYCIAASDFVVMTSLYEGHANVPLEAMACRKAIVASDVDGVSDSFVEGTAGFLVMPGDILTLARKILRLVENPTLRTRMGMRGGREVVRFAKQRVMHQYLVLIRQLLQKPR